MSIPVAAPGQPSTSLNLSTVTLSTVNTATGLTLDYASTGQTGGTLQILSSLTPDMASPTTVVAGRLINAPGTVNVALSAFVVRYYRADVMNGGLIAQSSSVTYGQSPNGAVSAVAGLKSFQWWWETWVTGGGGTLSLIGIPQGVSIGGSSTNAFADIVANLGSIPIMPYATVYATDRWDPTGGNYANIGCDLGAGPIASKYGGAFAYEMCCASNATRLQVLNSFAGISPPALESATFTNGILIDNGLWAGTDGLSSCTAAHAHQISTTLDTFGLSAVRLGLEALAARKTANPNASVIVNAGGYFKHYVEHYTNFYGTDLRALPFDQFGCENYLFTASPSSGGGHQNATWAAVYAASILMEGDNSTYFGQWLAWAYPTDKDENYWAYCTAQLCNLAYTSNLGVDGFNGHKGVWPEITNLRLGAPVNVGPGADGTLTGCYYREYANGWVIVNPTAGDITVTLPARLRRQATNIYDSSTFAGGSTFLVPATSGRVFTFQGAMADKYVSNFLGGGYIVGSDSNSGNTPADPYLTVAKATSVVTADQIIAVNAGGVTYSENSGSNFLNVPTRCSIIGDNGIPAIKGTATQAINLAVSGCTLQDLIVDGNSSGIRAVNVAVGSSVTTFRRITFKNTTGGQANIRCNAAGQFLINVDRCNSTLANGNAANCPMVALTTANSSSIINMQGCSTNGIGQMLLTAGPVSPVITFGYGQDGTTRWSSVNSSNVLSDNNSSGTIASLTVARGDVSGHVNAFQLSSAGTVTTFSFSDVNVGAGASGTAIGIYVQCASTTGTIQGNTHTGSTAGIFLKIQNTLANGITIGGAGALQNVINVTGGNDNILILAIGSGLNIGLNTVISDANAHAVALGSDGYTFGVAPVASTGTQAFGDASARAYIDQPFTYTPTRFTAQGNTIGAIFIDAKKQGTPIITATLKIHADNAGNPGTLLATSDWATGFAGLTASNQTYAFWFNTDRVALVNATKYHLVLHCSAVDAANYILLDKGTAAGLWSTLQTSSDGSSWSAGTGALRANVGTALYECVNPVIQNLNITTTAATTVHALYIGATDGLSCTGCTISTTGYGAVIKATDGAVNPAVFSGNEITCTGLNAGTVSCIFTKGCSDVLVTQNKATITSGSQTVYQSDGNNDTTLAAAYNGVPDRNTTNVHNSYINLSSTVTSLMCIAGNANGSYFRVQGLVQDFNRFYIPNGATFGSSNLGTSNAATTSATFANWKTNTSLDANSTLINVSVEALAGSSSASIAGAIGGAAAAGTGTVRKSGGNGGTGGTVAGGGGGAGGQHGDGVAGGGAVGPPFGRGGAGDAGFGGAGGLQTLPGAAGTEWTTKGSGGGGGGASGAPLAGGGNGGALGGGAGGSNAAGLPGTGADGIIRITGVW